MRGFLIILLLVSIAGLAVFVALSAPLPAEADTRRAQFTKIGRELYEYRLEDGTRCVVWDGIRAGGIACDWRKP